jgi:diphthamide biosynthesis enzyme Dph1/Dph2-like protein
MHGCKHWYVMCRMAWAVYNPYSGQVMEGVPPEMTRLLRRRNFLVEKARNANIIGICCEVPDSLTCLLAVNNIFVRQL